MPLSAKAEARLTVVVVLALPPLLFESVIVRISAAAFHPPDEAAEEVVGGRGDAPGGAQQVVPRFWPWESRPARGRRGGRWRRGRRPDAGPWRGRRRWCGVRRRWGRRRRGRRGSSPPLPGRRPPTERAPRRCRSVPRPPLTGRGDGRHRPGRLGTVAPQGPTGSPEQPRGRWSARGISTSRPARVAGPSWRARSTRPTGRPGAPLLRRMPAGPRSTPPGRRAAGRRGECAGSSTSAQARPATGESHEAHSTCWRVATGTRPATRRGTWSRV